VPAILGAALGGLIGVVVLPTPLPACAAPNVSSEVVTQRFLERLGSSADSISECWTPGRLSAKELQTYVAAKPPTAVRLVRYGIGQGQNSEVYIQWVVALTWSGAPPEGWPDEDRWITLLRHDNPTRWTVDSTVAPRP
jgi:hypothetical protein